MKGDIFTVIVCSGLLRRSFGLCLGAGEQAFLLERADRLGRENHGDLLPIDNEGLFLKVWFEDSLGASQREAHIVAELLTLASQFTSCCHILIPLIHFILLQSVLVYAAKGAMSRWVGNVVQ